MKFRPGISPWELLSLDDSCKSTSPIIYYGNAQIYKILSLWPAAGARCGLASNSPPAALLAQHQNLATAVGMGCVWVPKTGGGASPKPPSLRA